MGTGTLWIAARWMGGGMVYVAAMWMGAGKSESVPLLHALKC